MTDSELFNFIGMFICYGVGIIFALIVIVLVVSVPLLFALKLHTWIAIKSLSKVFGSKEEFELCRKSYAIAVRSNNKNIDGIKFIKDFLDEYYADSKNK